MGLQLRKAALCVRFADGSERHFRAGEHTIRTIIIAASASITTEALRWCTAELVGVLIVHRNGKCYSFFSYGIAVKHARKELALRRRQFKAVRVKVAARIVAIKVGALGLPRDVSRVFVSKLANAKGLVGVLAVEAEASCKYWRGWKGFTLSFKAVFGARHALHPLNAMLNYGYAVALAQITRAIAALGLDPCFGFLHSDKPGRLSFSYDCLELIRTRIDRIVFAFAAARGFERRDLIEAERGHVRLSAQLAREIAGRVLRKIPFRDYVSIARKLATLF